MGRALGHFQSGPAGVGQMLFVLVALSETQRLKKACGLYVLGGGAGSQDLGVLFDPREVLLTQAGLQFQASSSASRRLFRNVRPVSPNTSGGPCG